MNISEYFRFAELAQAAYYDLQSGIVDPDVLYDDGDGMAKKQAEDFADNWTVLDQYDGMVEDTYYDEFGDEQTFLNPTGLSVTLFDDGKGNQVVAIRGTDDLDDFVTDFIDIALLGTTEFQAQYSALSAQVQTWIVDGTLQSDFSVVGHSLGGFLAQALTGEFDSYISHTYTYNAPGFTVQPGITNIATEIMDLLGIANASVPEEKITNIRALEGIFATAGLGQMIGDIQVISIEDQAPSLWANHYMVNTVDSLAVYNLFAQVDSTLTIDEVTGIIRASSNKADHTLESAVTALGKLFVTGFTPRSGSEYDTNRDDLYTDIDKITDKLANTSGLSIEVLATTDTEGNVTPFSPTAIETQARNNIAYRYALVNLNPFAVVEEQVAA
ncbi:MAG: hypothetical protein RBR03_03565 [Desulfuromonas thiophila]|jgi:hypothetical protein|nr:hypothetical protein [Desulfuromonas thiophila]